MSEHEVKKALSKEGGKKKKEHVHGVHVRRAAGGGYIARHEMADEEGNPSGNAAPEHVINDPEALQAHMQEHMGDQPAAGAAPAPGAGAGGEPDGDEAPQAA